jgi:hypothetical protein
VNRNNSYSTLAIYACPKKHSAPQGAFCGVPHRALIARAPRATGFVKDLVMHFSEIALDNRLIFADTWCDLARPA